MKSPWPYSGSPASADRDAVPAIPLPKSVHVPAPAGECCHLAVAVRLTWLPPTCGYRLIAEGRDLAWWHPLVSGDPDTVHKAGVSVRGRVTANEKDVPDADLEDYIVAWPGKWPKGSRGSVKPAKRK